MAVNPVMVSRVNANPKGQAVIAEIGTSELAYYTAYTIMSNPDFTDAIKTVKGFQTEKDAWTDFMSTGWKFVQGQWGSWYNAKDYMDDISKKYTEASGRQKSWKEQSGVAAGTGRRPTILTSGRGAAGTPALALTKLKKQLGK